MPLLQKAPLVRITVDIFPDDRVAVSLEPKRSRWPEHEGPDRLGIPLGFAALALARAEGEDLEIVQRRLRDAAEALARGREGGGAEDLLASVSGFEIVAADRVGNPRIEVELRKSSRGPIPGLVAGRAAPPSPVAIADAATATFAVCLAPRAPEVQLASALAIEGIFGWHRPANTRRRLPEEAVAFALRYAETRLVEQGHTPPAELFTALDERRKIPGVRTGLIDD